MRNVLIYFSQNISAHFQAFFFALCFKGMNGLVNDFHLAVEESFDECVHHEMGDGHTERYEKKQ